MGIFTSKYQKSLATQKGQSVVEYVMLMAVVGTFVTTLMNSALIKDLLGPNSSFFNAMRSYTEVTYQYGHNSPTRNQDYSTGGVHDTYAISPGMSRFWTAIDEDR
jgi:hypothetical protein